MIATNILTEPFQITIHLIWHVMSITEISNTVDTKQMSCITVIDIYEYLAHIFSSLCNWKETMQFIWHVMSIT